MSGRTSSSSHVSFRIPKKKTNTKSEDVQVQSPLARLPGSHHCDYPLKEWRLSANNTKPSTKGRRQKDCSRHSSNDEESVGDDVQAVGWRTFRESCFSGLMATVTFPLCNRSTGL